MSIPSYALSIRQPWAWLIAAGFKDVENRSWSTPRRGTIAVHAGSRIDTDGLRWVQREFPQIELPVEFPTGGIIGVTRIVDCVEDMEDSPWFIGRYGFVLRDSRLIDPIPCRGALSFFRWMPK